MYSTELQHWQDSGLYAYGCSRQTWERFLQGTAIRDRGFIAFYRVLEVDGVHRVYPSVGLSE